MLLSALRLHIRANRVQRGAAHAAHKVGPMPKQRLPIKGRQVLCKPRPRTPCAGSFEVVDQHRDVQRRMDVSHKVDMVGFAAKLQELAAPRLQAVVERALQIVKQRGR